MFRPKSGVNAHDYAFLGGARVNLGRAFVHALIDVDTTTGSLFGFSVSQTGFAAAFASGGNFVEVQVLSSAPNSKGVALLLSIRPFVPRRSCSVLVCL
jgi:hypothetical protein